MKSDQLVDSLRWVGVMILLGVALSWGATPAYSAIVPEPKAVLVKVEVLNNELLETKDRVKELEARERQNYVMELEGQRKQVDWWLSFLGVLAALLAIFGALIPYLMARKDKEIIEQDKAQIRQLLEEVKSMKAEAKDSVDEIHRHEAEAEAAKKAVMNYQSGTPAAENKEAQGAAAKIEQDKTADPLLRLRAEAVSASKPESAEKAYKLWAALAELVTTDASAQFNAGYWAQKLANQAQGREKLNWLKQAKEKYHKALDIKPDMHEAAYNWGVALDDEARALSATDLDSARALWKQAGEKYRQVLEIKLDTHEAANNWGYALTAEARALSATDLDSARALWKQAGEKFQKALDIKPDKHEAAKNWGDVLDDEARALSATDLDSARALWKQAGEKYQQALDIKPDKHEAANNWGNALFGEANAIATYDPAETKRLLVQAEQLLLQHAEAAPGVVAYNLACVYGLRGDVQNCLQWLKVSKRHDKLPDCKHLREDKDLDLVRNDPAFAEWFKQVCP